MDKYKKIFMELFHLEEGFAPESIVRGETGDWDSIGHIALVTKLEEAFDIMLEPEDILHLRSYMEGIDMMKKYGIQLKAEQGEE